MNDKVHALPGTNIPYWQVLDAARERDDLDTVIVIGRTHEGRLYVAASGADPEATLYEMESAKRWLLEIAPLEHA